MNVINVRVEELRKLKCKSSRKKPKYLNRTELANSFKAFCSFPHLFSTHSQPPQLKITQPTFSLRYHLRIFLLNGSAPTHFPLRNMAAMVNYFLLISAVSSSVSSFVKWRNVTVNSRNFLMQYITSNFMFLRCARSSTIIFTIIKYYYQLNNKL